MMIFYVIYCIVLHFNAPLEKWAHSLKLPIKLPTKEEQSALVTYKNLPDTTYSQQQQQAVTSLSQEPTAAASQQQQKENYQDYSDPNAAWDPNASWDPNAAWNDSSSAAAQSTVPVAAATNSWNATAPSASTNWDPNASWDQSGQQNYAYSGGEQSGGGDLQSISPAAAGKGQQVTSIAPQAVAVAGEPEFYKSKEVKAQDIVNPLDKPIEGGIPAQISWAVVYPIHYMCRLTMPDCRTEKYRNWYAFTFLVSMIWISFYSYFMVGCIKLVYPFNFIY